MNKKGGKKVESLPERAVDLQVPMEHVPVEVDPMDQVPQIERTEPEPVQMEGLSDQEQSNASTAASLPDESEKKYFEPNTPYNSDADEKVEEETDSSDVVAKLTSTAILTKKFAFRSVKNFAITTTVVSIAWFPALCVGFWTGVVTLAVPASRPLVKQSIVNLERKMSQALQN